MPTTIPPDPSLERLRFVSTAVQYSGRDQFARITTYDGAVAVRDYVAGDPLRYHDGLLLGAVLGSVAAPFVVWLAQGSPWLKRWRVVLDAHTA